MSDPTRRQILAAAATIPTLSFISVPGTASTADALTPALADQFTRRGFSPGDELRQFSGGRIAVHIPYEEGDKDRIENWVEDHSDRDIIAEHDTLDSLAVRLPAEDLYATNFGSAPIDDLGGVDGEIDGVFRMHRPEPVDLLSEDEWGLDLDWTESFALSWFSSFDAPGTSDVAFDDAETGTVAEAREYTGASDTLVDSIDTSTVTVAVIDTGFNHADGDILGDTSRILDVSEDLTSDETVSDEGLEAVEDGDGHGTHVASTIAANPTGSDDTDDYRGYLPDAELLILKALGDDGGGSTDDITRAVTKAADEGADIVCMSLGSPVWSEELARALGYAVDADCIPVVAAGNNRTTPQPFVNSPADAEYAITVTAGEVRPAEETRGGHFSAVGPDPGTVNLSDGKTAGAEPDIAAPGVELDALVANTRNTLTTETLSGTSMATPCVAGGLGLLKASSSVEWEFESVQERLMDYAEPAPHLGLTEAGAGWLNVGAAIDEEEWDDNQESVRTQQSVQRDDAWRALSDAYGGFITRWFL